MTTAHRVDLPALVWAEFRRARQTRATVAITAAFTAFTVLLIAGRVWLNRDDASQLGAELVTVSADGVGFGVLLAAALAVAKDHGTGANDLLRLLAPSRPRPLLARACGIGILALIAVAAAMLAGVAALLVMNPSALVDLGLIDSVARTAVTTVLLVGAGLGIGALTRASAGATFTAVALYLLLPIALMIAGLAGVGWATDLTEATPTLLGAEAISPGAEHWAAVGGVALWTGALAALGTWREARVT